MEFIVKVSGGRVFCGIYKFKFELLKLVELCFIWKLRIVILDNFNVVIKMGFKIFFEKVFVFVCVENVIELSILVGLCMFEV